MNGGEIKAGIDLIAETQGPVAALRALSNMTVTLAQNGLGGTQMIWQGELLNRLHKEDPTHWLTNFPTRKQAKAELKFRRGQGLDCEIYHHGDNYMVR